MRVLSVVFALLFLAAVATAQTPSSQPVGTLAQVMRGILFPNSNLIFDVQSQDPAAPPEAESRATVTSTFASIYTGWQVVENAAVALAEAQHLITMPGRLCENGRPVPCESSASCSRCFSWPWSPLRRHRPPSRLGPLPK